MAQWLLVCICIALPELGSKRVCRVLLLPPAPLHLVLPLPLPLLEVVFLRPRRLIAGAGFAAAGWAKVEAGLADVEV